MLSHFEGFLSIFNDRMPGRVPCCDPTRPAIETLRGPEFCSRADRSLNDFDSGIERSGAPESKQVRLNPTHRSAINVLGILWV